MPDFHALLLQNIGTVMAGLFSLLALLILVWLKKYFVTWKVYDVRQQKIDRLFADHEARLSRQGEQIAVVEGIACTISDALAKLPQREDLLTLEISITEMRGSLRELGASVLGVKDLVERQEAQTAMLQEHVLGLRK